MLNRFKSDISGNVAMMFSVVIIAVMSVLALAVDGTRMLSTQSKLQDVSDAAALAGAYVADTRKNDREQIVRDTIAMHLASIGSDISVGDLIIEFDDVNSTLSVSIPAEVSMFFANAVGVMDKNVVGKTVTSYAIENVNPVSIAFVLDSSGSMTQATSSGEAKIDTLKSATRILFDSIEESAPRTDVLRRKVRSGMTVYNSAILPDYTVNMDYGWNHVLNMTQTLSAEGGTNSTDAFQTALDMLLYDSVQPEDLKRFIIFMTDGANNDPDYSDQTQALCTMAKENGVRIYSVAFAAPAAGEALLLQCASPNDDETVSEEGNFDYENDEEAVDRVCDNEIDNDGTSPESSLEECEAEKSKNYFDASNGDEFKAAFREIGAQIGKLETRIVN